MKSWIIKIVGVLVAIVLAGIIILGVIMPKVFVIGSVSGAENEYVTIDGVTYIKDMNPPEFIIHNTNKESFLGFVKNGDIVMRVYDIVEKEKGDYIHCLWGWEGSIYVRQSEKN